MDEQAVVQGVSEFIAQYYDEVGKPVSMVILNRRFNVRARKVGTTLDAVLFVLKGRGEVHELLINTGARYLLPESVWASAGKSQRFYLKRDLEVDPQAEYKKSKDELDPVDATAIKPSGPNPYSYLNMRDKIYAQMGKVAPPLETVPTECVSELDRLNVPSEGVSTPVMPGNWED